jgi:hypothetical protein
MGTREEKEAQYAKRILDRADKILASVDEAFIVNERGHKPRSMPSFRPEEISLGKILGTGGFGIVNEVTKFTLDPDDCLPNEQNNPNSNPGRSNAVSGDGSDDDNDDAVDTQIVEPKPEELSSGDHFHYDIRKARHMMDQRCMRKGVARYALKRLHTGLSELERARGMVDLAVEAKYLSIIWHPNISK